MPPIFTQQGAYTTGLCYISCLYSGVRYLCFSLHSSPQVSAVIGLLLAALLVTALIELFSLTLNERIAADWTLKRKREIERRRRAAMIVQVQ